MPDPWDRPDRRQVLRWRGRHRFAVQTVAALVIGWFLSPWWLAVSTVAVTTLAIEAGHKLLDRRYDRMREVHDHAT